MFQAVIEKLLKSCCVLQDHYDDERDKTMFHNTTPDLQEQDQDQSNKTKTKISRPRLRPRPPEVNKGTGGFNF